MPYDSHAHPWTMYRQMWEARDELSKTWDTDYRDMIIDWIKMTELDDVEHWENLPSALYQ